MCGSRTKIECGGCQRDLEAFSSSFAEADEFVPPTQNVVLKSPSSLGSGPAGFGSKKCAFGGLKIITWNRVIICVRAGAENLKNR